MDISKHIEKAKEASRKKNYDFAISLFREILEIKPDQVDARRALREAALKKYSKSPPPFIFRFLQGLPGRAKIFLFQKLKKHEKVLAACESVLCSNPRSKQVNSILAASSIELGFQETAILALETLIEAYPREIVALKGLGRLHYNKGELNDALRYYESALEIDPRDQGALRARKNLAAEGALIETGFQTASSSMELIKDKEKQKNLVREERLVKTEEDVSLLEKEFKERLAENPEDGQSLLKMARLLADQERYEEALPFLERKLQLSPQDYDCKTMQGDLQLRILRRDLSLAEEEGQKEKADLLRKEKTELECAEYRWRVEEHPTDLGLRFQFGRSLFQLNCIDESIAEFQKSLKDPKLRVDSLIMLGNAFLRKEMFDLASNQFTRAMEDLNPSSPKGMEISYSLGSIYERMGDVTRAREEFARIYETDITFRDVAQKMDSLGGK